MEPLVLSSRQNSVGTLTFNRPEQRNAMSVEMMELFGEKLRMMGDDPAIRCVVLEGAGGNFMAGGDIKAWQGLVTKSPDERSADFKERLDNAFPTVELLDRFEKPIILAMRGHAAGAGLCMVLAADIVIADESARFHFANIRAALVPDMGITYHLPRRIGERQAIRLSLLGIQLDARQALAIGLADEIVAPDALESAVSLSAAALVAAPARAIAETKKLFRLSRQTTLDRQFAAERDALCSCVAEADFLEAVNAFAERRAPKFGASA